MSMSSKSNDVDDMGCSGAGAESRLRLRSLAFTKHSAARWALPAAVNALPRSLRRLTVVG
jgi:hypothetical protein